MNPKKILRSNNLPYAPALLVCAMLGAMIPLQPVVSLAIVLCFAVAALLIASRMTLRKMSLGLVLSVVLGYLFVGRGFAYVGLGSLYVGEISLAVVAIVAATSRRQRKALLPLAIAVVFIVYGVVRTLPFLNEFGLLAIRDAALYYYILFGVLLYFSLTESEVRSGLRIVGEAIPFYLAWSFIQLGNDITGFLPNIQWSGAPVGFWVTKPGDRAVVLAAVAAYVLLGLPELLGVRRKVPSVVFWSSWIGLAAVAAIGARGGLLAIALAIGVVIGYRRSRELFRMFLIGATVMIFIISWNPSIKVGSYRELSVEQFTANVTSIFRPSRENSGAVDQNRDWRLEFWKTTYTDTMQSEQKWFGRGYGINLATQAGFQIDSNHVLRSPHNVFVTVIARMGIVGIVLWGGLLASFLVVLHRVHARAEHRGQDVVAASMVWGIAYTVAVLINATFDVYLEGPQGAIPFWCAFGMMLVIAAPVLRNPQRNVPGLAVRDRELSME